MSAEFLADESVDFRIINYLQENGVAVLPARDHFRGSSDKRILQLSRETGRILITEDSDFGEWVFAHHEQAVGVIFLRYRNDQARNIATTIAQFVQKRGDSLRGTFTTITPKKVRIRAI